jgi:hypothetical protein
LSYGDIREPLAPAITIAFGRFISEARRLALVAGSVSVGTEGASSRPEVEKAVEILQASASMLFAKIGDNFQAYLADLLMLIYETHPHTFFRRKFDARYAFEASDISALRRIIIEEQVGDLSYKFLPEIQKFVFESTGFKIFDPEISLAGCYKIMNIRNIITHNRGVANSVFLSRDSSHKEGIGDPEKIRNFSRVNNYLTILAKKLDARAILKFNFPAEALHMRTSTNV